MSVPDWPNSYGYNMFLFPPRLWIGGILYEHTHRLMGTVVGMLSIVLCAWAWKVEPRRWVRRLATGVLGAVIVQGVLGGLRVVLVELDLAIVHACFAQAFFCLTALMCVVTSRWWFEARGVSEPRDANEGRRLIALASACLFAIYLQLIVGAMMRHYQAGLAIPDLPLAYGKLLPPFTAEGLERARQMRMWDAQLFNSTSGLPVTLNQIWLHFAHRVGAVVVSALLIALILTVVRRRESRAILRPAVALAVLLVTQVTLGVLTVLWRKPADVASMHVAVGALTLLTTFVVLVRAMRVYLPAWRRQSFGFEVPTSRDTGHASVAPA
jgi:cytochrome c oxidase assembly protein subunit 15